MSELTRSNFMRQQLQLRLEQCSGNAEGTVKQSHGQLQRGLFIAFIATLFTIPSTFVVAPVGAAGWVANILAIVLAALVVVNWISGRGQRRLGYLQLAIGLYVADTSLSYAFSPYRALDTESLLSGDRWLLTTFGLAGIIWAGRRVLEDTPAVLRASQLIVFGAAFSGLVAVAQWALALNYNDLVSSVVPVLRVNSTFGAFQERGSLSRVTGTAIHPIELGVVAGMLLPLSIAVLICNKRSSWALRVIPVAALALALPASVSRAAILTTLLSMAIFIVLTPSKVRLRLLVAAVLGGVAQFAIRPGYLATLLKYVFAGANDSSIATRLQDYSFVEKIVASHPWIGQGGGTFLAPPNTFDILDNQFLGTLINTGILGLIALLLLVGLSLGEAAFAFRRVLGDSDDTRRFLLGAAIAGIAAGTVSMGTFDFLSFGQATGALALLIAIVSAISETSYSVTTTKKARIE